MGKAIKAERRRLGERLRALRKGFEWSQTEAAENIGLHPVHVSRLEGGTANVTISTLVAVALAYKVPLRALFEEEHHDAEQPKPAKRAPRRQGQASSRKTTGGGVQGKKRG